MSSDLESQTRTGNPTPPPIQPVTTPNHTVEGEKEMFTELAIAYSFSNPRLLWRLMQSWRLLKSIVLLGSYDLVAAEPWLRLLFWREWLFQQDTEKRQNCQEWPLSNSLRIVPSKIRETLPSELMLDAYWQKCVSIDAVLLPAAPTKVKEVDQREI